MTSSGSAGETTYEGWTILELMGHRRLAGYVREVEIAGHGMFRLDVPGDRCDVCGHEERWHSQGGICGGEKGESECYCAHIPPLPVKPVATQFYSPQALYCLTPTTEEIARAVARPPTPAHRWELPAAVIRDPNE